MKSKNNKNNFYEYARTISALFLYMSLLLLLLIPTKYLYWKDAEYALLFIVFGIGLFYVYIPLVYLLEKKIYSKMRYEHE